MRKKQLKQIEVKSLQELRHWLAKHHKQSESIWLVTYKKSKPAWYLDYHAVVDEALCFGWIDSLPKALDEHRKMLRLSPRRKGSAWSKINRGRVKVLVKKKKMTRAGLSVVEAAVADGSWDALKSIDNNRIPPDLLSELKRHENAKKNFLAFPPSSKRAILEWITQAKHPETRKKRVLQTASMAAKNLRANHYRQSKKK